MPTLLRFEWPYCSDGYLIKSADWQSVESPQKSRRTSGMGIIINLKKDSDTETRWLVPRTSHDELVKPFEDHHGLFMEFANLKQDEEAVLQFANRFGQLTTPGTYELLQEEESVGEWYRNIELLRGFVERWREGSRQRLADDLTSALNTIGLGRSGTLHLFLMDVLGTDRLELCIAPNDLLGALWVQFALAVADDTKLRRCTVCPTWFSYGIGTGRRKSAHYCSPRCRKAAHRKREALK